MAVSVTRCVETLAAVRVLCDSHARGCGKSHSIRKSSKRQWHTPDRLIRTCAEGPNQLVAGKELDKVSWRREFFESTYERWLARCVRTKANDAKRLKKLEAENTRVVADGRGP